MTTGKQHEKWVIGLVLAAWLGLGVMDWFMRFHWFGWHTTLVRKVKAQKYGPYKPFMVWTNAPSRGGDLSRLIGIPEAAEPFEDERVSSVNYTDDYGFRNKPPLQDEPYDVMVLGDSFMNMGWPMTNTFAGWYSRLSNRTVYHHAIGGRGAFLSLNRFLYSDRFNASNYPSVVVFGLLEREISGINIVGMVHQLHKWKTKRQDQILRAGGVKWYELHPYRLKSTLPNSSALAQFSRTTWNRLRYRVLGRITDDVVVSMPLEDRSFLFFTESLNAIRWSEEVRDIPRVVWGMGLLNDTLEQLGMSLVVVLIPDKASVYQDLVPERIKKTGEPLDFDFLNKLEPALKGNGLQVVNLLPVFRKQAEARRQIYYRDDTHWNPEGIRIAVEVTKPVVESILDNHESHEP